MSEYAWMCLNKWDSEYASGPKYSEYGRVLNMRELHSVLNMQEYALAEFWKYLRFSICHNMV